MQARTPRFDRATQTSGQTPIFRATIIEGDTVLAQPVTVSVDVTADRTATNRYTIQADIVDKTGALVPKLMSDKLAPFGREIFVERGFQYTDVETTSADYGTLNGAVLNQWDGELVSMKVDEDGALTLGP